MQAKPVEYFILFAAIEGRHNQAMNVRKILFTAGICLFGLFLLNGCGKEEALSENISAAEESGVLSITLEPEKEKSGASVPESPSPTEIPAPTPEPDLTGLLLNITVEIGTEELMPSDFLQAGFEDKAVTIISPLTTEELCTLNTYLVPLIYNECRVTARVNVVDTTPPVFEGLKSFTVNRGDSISYKKGVTVTDNSGEEISYDIDNSSFDINICGAYTISYSASDSSGNTVKEWITVTVLEPDAVIDESTVLPMLDKIIASVITPEMTKYDQAYQLWKWIDTHMTYSSYSKYHDYWEAINGGLTTKKGDCYVYYALYSALLTRCEIDNLCVKRTGGKTNHYWNLVNVGDGWYHCDSSPRPRGDRYKCFMQTDEQIAAYTAAFAVNGSPNYYTFDPDQYPERNTEIIFPNDIK